MTDRDYEAKAEAVRSGVVERIRNQFVDSDPPLSEWRNNLTDFSALHLYSSRWDPTEQGTDNPVSVIMYMVQAGVDLYCKDVDGRTPIYYAIARDIPSLVEAFLVAGVDPSRPCEGRSQPLGIAGSHRVQLDTLEILLHAGADQDWMIYPGTTVRDWLISRYDPGIIPALQELLARTSHD